MALRKPPKNDAQIDLFVPVFGDIASRDGVDLMEFPFFSLSKKKRFEPLTYQNKARGIEIIVSGGKPHGLATIWDKDILIWAISQVRESLDRGETPKREIFFHPYQFLKAARRGNGKRQYQLFRQALARLTNTMVYTTIRREGETQDQGFHWIERYRSATENKTGEGVGMWSITLADWLFDLANEKSLVLTLDDDYFLLTGGRERWLYLIARKHGGYQENGFSMAMETLYEKSATSEKYKFWAYEIRKLVKADNLPGYHLAIWRKKETGQEFINFTRRSKLAFSHPAHEMDVPRPLKKMISGY